MDFASEERLTVVDHPLIKHKLSVIRNEDTPDYLFRQTVREITLLEGYAATQDLATRSVEVKTPIATCECESIRGIEPVVVPCRPWHARRHVGLDSHCSRCPFGHVPR